MAAFDPLSDHNYICEVMNRNCHDIASEVKYKYIRVQLKAIFSPMTLSRDEGRDRSDYDIMVKICDSAKRLSLSDFSKFVDAIETDNASIAQKIRNKFQELSGRALPSQQKQELPVLNVVKDVPCDFEQTPVLCQSDLQQNRGTLSFLSAQAPATRLELTGLREETRYSMNTSPRGKALIINNEIFQFLSSRDGSERDMEMTIDMFKFLDFEVSVKKNQTSEEMKSSLYNFANDTSLGSVSALAVVIMSHGHSDDTIFGIDGEMIHRAPVNYITKFDCQQSFTGKKCPLMIGKPKLFIIQACRGDEEDQPLTNNPISEAWIRSDSVNRDEVSSDANEGDLQSDGPRLADTADMCFVHSSSLGYKAYRSPTSGSPFIEVLTKNVLDHAHNTEIRDIIQKVQQHFSQTQLGNERMTMPDCNIRLVKPWYLMPPTASTR
ncbi:unnamed protein product [Lymnaea stagnalis]|uniref:Uncharacterized protein n=1 Tax=Lymnaea stagnalis TaxID=6523 RepID=A0AAV2HG05_LYMST